MAGKNLLKVKPTCGAVRKDGKLCVGVATNVWGGRCEYHGLIAIGREFGWRVRGNRRAGVFVADRDGRVLVADTPAELLELIKTADQRDTAENASAAA